MEIANWMLWTGTKESDYILFWSTLDAIKLAPKVDDTLMVDNQYTRLWGKLRMFCTWFNPMMSVCSIYNYEPDDEFWEEYRQFAQDEYGYQEGVWNYTSTWVDCARSFWNKKNPDSKVVSYRREFTSQEMIDVLNKWYWIIVSFKWNWNYNNDYMWDAVLNGRQRWDSTYGHVTCIYKIGSQYYVIDSKAGASYNTYKIVNSFEKLVEGGNFYPTSYVLLPDPNSNMSEQSFRKEYEKWIELGITTIPYEEAEQWKKEVVVQDVRLYNLIKEDAS